MRFCEIPWVALAFAMVVFGEGAAAQSAMPNIAPRPEVRDDGAIVTPVFDLPFSSFASEEARASFLARMREPGLGGVDIASTRRMTDDRMQPHIEAATRLYPFTSTRSTMGGVPVETFIPAGGVARENRDRVLIELHGGGFVAGGGGPGGAVESIPIAGVARIKVIAVDYRMAPEHRFPAASEDVAAVYRELLRTYRPENIGIYGCSAGGVLTGQAIAWFLKEDLPLPGAVGVFCASNHTFAEGDSAQLWTRMGSVVPVIPPRTPETTFGWGYMGGVSVSDPLAVPSASQDVLRAFPPTLFLTGTRSPEMSGAAQSHLELLELGVTSELALFDGMDHGFFSDPTLPESQRAYALIARFFQEHLEHRRGR